MSDFTEKSRELHGVRNDSFLKPSLDKTLNSCKELNMLQDGATSDENDSQHPVSLCSPRLCGLFSGQNSKFRKQK